MFQTPSPPPQSLGQCVRDLTLSRPSTNSLFQLDATVEDIMEVDSEEEEEKRIKAQRDKEDEARRVARIAKRVVHTVAIIKDAGASVKGFPMVCSMFYRCLLVLLTHLKSADLSQSNPGLGIARLRRGPKRKQDDLDNRSVSKVVSSEQPRADPTIADGGNETASSSKKVYTLRVPCSYTDVSLFPPG